MGRCCPCASVPGPRGTARVGAHGRREACSHGPGGLREVLSLTISRRVCQKPGVTEPPSPAAGAQHCLAEEGQRQGRTPTFTTAASSQLQSKQPTPEVFKDLYTPQTTPAFYWDTRGCFLTMRSQSISGGDTILRRDAERFQELTVAENPQTTHQVPWQFLHFILLWV